MLIASAFMLIALITLFGIAIREYLEFLNSVAANPRPTYV